MNRRSFVRTLGAAGSAAMLQPRGLLGQWPLASLAPSDGQTNPAMPFGRAVGVPDDGWRLWPDEKALWRNDRIYLPDEVDLARLPIHAPTGGWDGLSDKRGLGVTLPATVEQFYWGLTGFRPYREEYKFEASDGEVTNGAYYGVSWWWRQVEIPADFEGKRILLHIRAARQRAEVYWNEKLVGYSILEELPFECDITAAARPGANRLAIRITNPGGRLDWVDGGRLTWGGVEFQKSHGFGGLDRSLVLSAHGPVRIADGWVLNTPDVRTIDAHAMVEQAGGLPARGHLEFAVVDPGTGEILSRVAHAVSLEAGGPREFNADLTVAQAALWDLDTPRLYRLRLTWTPEEKEGLPDTRTVDFGFRWFVVDGLGRDAMFRLNGRRIRLYTSISWGFWALNGLFPIPELAEKEVRVAKQLGLNTLNSHRNLAKEDVLQAHDRQGLLRCLEPGGGLQAVGPANRPRGTAQRYMEAKILGMIRAFRSHPSVIHYILQNEAKLDLSNPNLARVFALMHREDPSRSIVGNDGFVLRSPQAWLQAYGRELHRSGPHASADGGAGGWWVDHTGHFSDVWQDAYYLSPREYYYRSADRSEIVEWGEMKGAAASDDHASVIEQIRRHGGRSYDLKDHREILAAYEGFLDRWGFRGSFPTASSLFRSIGRRAYESWGQFLENIRLCDQNDMAAVSGWESTAMENHSGLLDNFRDFKSDPRPIAESLSPIRPVAKQRQLVIERNGRATFDLYLLNDTPVPVTGQLHWSLIDPVGTINPLATLEAPPGEKDRFSYLLRESAQTGPLSLPGIWHSRLEWAGRPSITHDCAVLVVDPFPGSLRPMRIGLSGVPAALAAQLRSIPEVTAEDFTSGTDYALIVASGGTAGRNDPAVDSEGAYKPGAGSPVEVRMPDPVLAAVRSGTPLLALTPGAGQGAGVARQLADAGAFRFAGMVGPSRASWMGSWYFVRRHPLYEGMPVDQAMSIHYQVKGGGSDGWLVEGAGVEVVAGYGRDHDRRIGAGTFIARLGATPLVMHGILGMHPVLERRFLANALVYLAK